MSGREPPGFGLSPEDHAAVRAQIGRPPREPARVAVRCPCGLPAVVETFPIVDGAPFPTLYWLTCARANREVGRLEGAGFMSELNARLQDDAEFAEAFDAAQRDYVARRDALHHIEAGGVGGGPSGRIKCLHAHYAHHVVCGCNPVGEAVEAQTGPMLRPPPCVEP